MRVRALAEGRTCANCPDCRDNLVIENLPELTPEETAQGLHWQPTKKPGLFVVHNGRKIVHTYLSPETASLIGKGSLGRDDQEIADAMASEAGYGSLAESPGWYQLLVRLALKSDAGAISAVRELRASAIEQPFLRRDVEGEQLAAFQRGERPCPTCGKWPNLSIPLSAESVMFMAAVGDSEGKRDYIRRSIACAKRLQELEPGHWALQGFDPAETVILERHQADKGHWLLE
jgi:hypothetical protein